MRGIWKALAAAASLLVALEASAAGVFIVSRGGVEAYDEAKAGFIQMAYSLNLPSLNPRSVDLTGGDGDRALLDGLKAQNPQLVFAIGAYAARRVREALPDVWIVYTMVYYPDVEGLLKDPRMVGVGCLGSTKNLATLAKAFGLKGKALVVLHGQAVAPAVPALITRLNDDGFEAEGRSVSDPGALAGILSDIKDRARMVLLLPDPLTANADALRFIVSTCIENHIAPLALSEPLVASGALCAAFVPPEVAGNEAARVAQGILGGASFPTDKPVQPTATATAANKKTAEALKLKIPANQRIEVVYE
ncbi:MAG: ABC transporter substrate-binding protein [Acidobacteriota bacterium]